MFSSFILLVGLAIIWVLGFLVIGMLFNTNRVKNRKNINDSVTEFIKGVALGPFCNNEWI